MQSGVVIGSLMLSAEAAAIKIANSSDTHTKRIDGGFALAKEGTNFSCDFIKRIEINGKGYVIYEPDAADGT